jgi:hypothetical protein
MACRQMALLGFALFTIEMKSGESRHRPKVVLKLLSESG